MITKGRKGNSDTWSPTLHTTYDTPRLRAVLRKLSPFLQTRCFTWSSPSHRTGRCLSRQQSKNQTAEQFQCDFWKFSLQHSLLSPVALKAQTGPPASHRIHPNTSSLRPPPSLAAHQHSDRNFDWERWQLRV